MKKFLALLAFLLIAVIVVFFAIDNQLTFNGSRVKNPDLYELDFTRMTQDDAHDMTFRAGDTVWVEFQISRGRVDLIVTDENGTEIYRGNDIKDGKFSLTIPEDGTYHFSISAKKAAGSIRICPI